MRLLLVLSVLLVGFFVHIWLAPWLEIGGVMPDLLLILVIHLSLSERFDRVFHLQWAIGLLRDLYSGGGIGLYAGAYLMAGIVLSRFREGFFADHFLTQSAIAFGIGLQVYVVVLSYHLFLEPGQPRGLIGRAFGIPLYTGVITPPVLAGLAGVGLVGGRGRRR